MKILAIETSCDETAVAILDNRKILSNKIFSQNVIHKMYGGVIPEIAARNHVDKLPYLIEDAIKESSIKLKDLKAIAVTGGPGLIGGIMIGVMYAKTLAAILKKQFISVNHLEGHALTIRLINKHIKYPYLLLLVSGGHCQIITVHYLGYYEIMGTTLDDAVGEAFDKVAKMLSLDYPGGPKIEKYAKLGDEWSYLLSKPLLHKKNCNFSFSGLKTSVLNKIKIISKLSNKSKYNISASFQKTVADILIDKLYQASEIFIQKYKSNKKRIVISGGVASNYYIRIKINKYFSEKNFIVTYPPINLCTDNAVMIGYAAYERLLTGYKSNLKFLPQSRWAISEI